MSWYYVYNHVHSMSFIIVYSHIAAVLTLQ